MQENTTQAEESQPAHDAPITDQAFLLLENFAKATLVNLIDIAGMMPRGNEYRPVDALQKVIAKVFAVWFPNNPELLEICVRECQPIFGEVAMQTPEALQAWKDAVMQEVAKQRFERDKASAPRIIVPKGVRRGH